MSESKGSEKPALEDNAFDALERDFQEVLTELMGDRSLEKFRIEYEKLHKALKKSYEGEKRLTQKCRELNAEIVANAAKVSTALKLSQEDQVAIASLKKEIEKAWKMVDAAAEKEARARETIQSLKLEIANLSKLVEQGAGLTMGQEHSVNELLKIKEELTKDRDEKLSEIVELRQSLVEAATKQAKAEGDKREAELKIAELKEDINVRTHEAQRETRKRDKLDRELKAAKQDLDSKNTDAKSRQSMLNKLQEECTRLENSLKEQKMINERMTKENDLLDGRIHKVQQDYEHQLMQVHVLKQENHDKATELRLKEDEINSLRQENMKLAKLRETIQRKLRAVEDAKGETEHNKEILKSNIIGLERELEAMKKSAEIDRKKIDELTREKELLHKKMLKTQSDTVKQQDIVKLHEQSKKNLEHEIQNYKDEAQKQRKLIYQLEKERDKYINEASEMTQKCLGAMEEVKVKEMQIFDYKKKIAEFETKLKQQQNLYEAVRSDRNLYSKNLIESQDEISEMKRKLKIMNHQIDQLKEEIAAKNNALTKEKMDHQEVEKHKEQLKTELGRMRQEVELMKQRCGELDAENAKQHKIILSADAERLRQKKELDQVINERDILGTQLIRRNDELALLYEKIKIQQSTLNKGEIQYRQRLEDIRLLKLEVKKLRREKIILLKSVSNVDELRRELFHVQRELLRERTRCKALEEELENPMNIHRWRKLEGSDPSTYEMIQKIQTLQRRLISKTEEVVSKEMSIQEKEKLYIELKQILARQPGPEVAEQLQIYQQSLKDKTKQMKALSSELNMCEAQNAEYRYEIESLVRELHDSKNKYYLQKRKERNLKERERHMTGGMMPPIVTNQRQENLSRFTGGGFSLKQAQKA